MTIAVSTAGYGDDHLDLGHQAFDLHVAHGPAETVARTHVVLGVGSAPQPLDLLRGSRCLRLLASRFVLILTLADPSGAACRG